jgi:hypothetical protein
MGFEPTTLFLAETRSIQTELRGHRSPNCSRFFAKYKGGATQETNSPHGGQDSLVYTPPKSHKNCENEVSKSQQANSFQRLMILVETTLLAPPPSH